MDSKLLEILACPVCKAQLNYDKPKQQLICYKCKLSYKIEDGIPIMIITEAQAFEDHE